MEDNVQQDLMETSLVNVCHLFLVFNVKVVRFFIYIFISNINNLCETNNEKQTKWIKIGGLERNEQTILTNFYNSLTSNGSLNWDLSTDLCGQTGVICDSSTPKRIIQLYFSFFLHSLFLFFFFKTYWREIKKSNRDLRDKELQGSIPTQLLSLSYLQSL